MAEWSLVIAITVVDVAVRVLLTVVNNLTKEGGNFLYPGRVILLNSEEVSICLARFTTQCVSLRAIHIETLVTFVHSNPTNLHTWNHVNYRLTHSKISFSVNLTFYITKGYVFNRIAGRWVRNF